MPLQSKDRANVVFCYHPHFEADFSAVSGAAVPEMRILPDCERFFLITRTRSSQCGNKRLCHSTWLFCFSNILKIYAFSPNFPLVGSVIGGFYWLFLWNFKEIKHQPFSMTQPPTKGISHGFRQGENQMKRLSPRCGDETPPCCDRAKRKNFRKGHPRQSPRLPHRSPPPPGL